MFNTYSRDINLYSTDSVEVWASVGDYAFIHIEIKKVDRDELRRAIQLSQVYFRKLKMMGYEKVYAAHPIDGKLNKKNRIPRYFGMKEIKRDGKYIYYEA